MITQTLMGDFSFKSSASEAAKISVFINASPMEVETGLLTFMAWN